MTSENCQRHQSNLCFKHWRNYEKKGGLKFLTSLLTLAPYACLLNISFKSTWHRTDRTTVTRAFTSWICFSKSSTLSFTRSILFNITTSCYKRICHNVVVIWILDLWILTAAARINKRKLHLQILEVKIPKINHDIIIIREKQRISYRKCNLMKCFREWGGVFVLINLNPEIFCINDL